MFAYKRLNDIFNDIYNNEYITALELSNKFNMTDRTIRSDIQFINDTLKEYQTVIKLKRNKGYYIEYKNKELFQELLTTINNTDNTNINLDSSEERIKYLLYLLLLQESYITLDDLANKVYISKNTLQNYLKTIKELLPQYDLEYISKYKEGLKIIGLEENKRKCMIENVINQSETYSADFSHNQMILLQIIDLSLVKKIIIQTLQNHHIAFDDLNLKNLVLYTALSLMRIQKDFYVTSSSQTTLSKESLDLVNELTQELENQFEVVFSEGEKKHLYLQILAYTNLNVSSLNEDWLKECITDILDYIYEGYNFDLRKDKVLIKDLFNHFKSIFSTKTYAINKKNPLLNTIKTNFPLPFEITLTAVTKVFKDTDYMLTEDEIGYISLHIGAAIERCFSGTLERKNVILVCASGQATTRMLEARLNIFFNDKITIIKRMTYNDFKSCQRHDFKNIDFVISTIPLKSALIPTVSVDFALNSKDVEKVSKFISTISHNSLKKSAKFFHPNTFIYLNQKEDKNTILSMLCDTLKKDQLIEDDFLQKVLLRESLAKTNMNEVFAIPHPIESWSKETRVAVAISKEPVLWSGQDTVQIIFLLAIKKGDQLDIEHLYDLFIDIVNNPHLQQNIIHSKDFDGFLENLAHDF